MKPERADKVPVGMDLTEYSFEDALCRCMAQFSSGDYIARHFTVVTSHGNAHTFSDGIKPFVGKTFPNDGISRHVNHAYELDEWCLCVTLLLADYSTKSALCWSPGA